MKNVAYLLIVITLLSFTLSSCGVIFGGAKYNATIIAREHPNASIYVNGNNIGQGTARGIYDRNEPLTVELRQEGCPNHSQTFDNTFRTGNFILSVITWGLLGIAVDLASGAAYKPDDVSNPAIQKQDLDNFIFTTDYPGCPAKL